MKRYAFLIVVAMLAAGLTTIYADGNSPSPFDDNEKVIEQSTSDTSSLETATLDAKEDKKDEKKDDSKTDGKYPVKGTVQGDNLRLREWPWGPVMGKYFTGNEVTVTGESGEFYAVTINGVSGYMHKNYISIPGADASRVAPYYPGDTASGGYLSKDEGTQHSNDIASGKKKAPATSSGTESASLAAYKGGKLSPDNFIALFGPVARDSMKNTGVPASVTLAQAILETGWGGSTIGDAKNLFGIKGTGPAGTTVVNTKECYDGKTYVTIKDGFRKYNTWQESIDDHAKLVSGGRYKSAWDNFQSTHNADEFARGIHKAGYATSPTYASNLISLMKQYNLYKWDN